MTNPEKHPTQPQPPRAQRAVHTPSSSFTAPDGTPATEGSDAEQKKESALWPLLWLLIPFILLLVYGFMGG